MRQFRTPGPSQQKGARTLAGGESGAQIRSSRWGGHDPVRWVSHKAGQVRGTEQEA